MQIIKYINSDNIVSYYEDLITNKFFPTIEILDFCSDYYIILFVFIRMLFILFYIIFTLFYIILHYRLFSSVHKV